jgi:outer membrane lipoprotein-sorting protein
MSHKHLLISFVILGFWMIYLPLFFEWGVRAELSGDQIIAKVDELMPSMGKFTMDFTMIRPGKDNRTSRIQVFIHGSDKILVRYLAPAQEKGQGYLRLGEDEWLYLPNANKSIRVSGRQSMQGSDLSNDDILRLKLTNDYNAQIVGAEVIDGQNHYVLELTAKQSSATYGKLKFWVRKKDDLPSKTEYYAISGKLIKTMTYSQNKEIGGRVRPTVMEITSELRKGYKTVLDFIDANYDLEIPDSYFTKMYLEKGK